MLAHADVEKCTLGGVVNVTQGTFQDHSIENDATIHAVLIPWIQTRDQVQNLVDQIVVCNPGTDRARLIKGATFDADGMLKDW